jgi:hypothetical protein
MRRFVLLVLLGCSPTRSFDVCSVALLQPDEAPCVESVTEDGTIRLLCR